MTTINKKETVQPELYGFAFLQLYISGDLSGTQTTGAGVNMLGSAVYHCLNTLDVGLPGSVGTSVRVGNLDAEYNTLTAEIAFSHTLHLLNHRKLHP